MLSSESSVSFRVKALVEPLLKFLLLLPLRLLDSAAVGYSAFAEWIRPRYGLFLIERHSARAAERITQVEHQGADARSTLVLFTPNSLCQYRADTFSTKEPETLEWIDRFGGEGALFDIGANVGLYSIYYAKSKPGNVYSFEPSVFNLALLAKNINANGVESKVRIIVNPLTAQNGFADFSLQTTTEGGALSSFGVDYGQDGTALAKVFSYKIAGFTLDFLLEVGAIQEPPSLIKLDVDGIEHLVLRGAARTIADPACRSVLVEVNDDLESYAGEVRTILSSAGFSLSKERHARAACFSDGTLCNQIWIKQ